MNELPSVALTRAWLVLCRHYGSHCLTVRMVAKGCSNGVSGLPESDDWKAWDADEMRHAVEYLRRIGGHGTRNERPVDRFERDEREALRPGRAGEARRNDLGRNGSRDRKGPKWRR